jgi:MSHA pilin protein MshC
MNEVIMVLKRFSSRSTGFTLIEVVFVLILLGILAAVAVGRQTDTNAELVSQTDVIKSHLRYAQSRAMAMEEVWGVNSTGSSYYLYSARSGKVHFPGENSTDIILADKGIASMTSGSFAFDETGRPLNENDTIILVALNGKNATITIIPFTGYIP